jgi:hypothetical protein
MVFAFQVAIHDLLWANGAGGAEEASTFYMLEFSLYAKIDN